MIHKTLCVKIGDKTASERIKYIAGIGDLLLSIMTIVLAVIFWHTLALYLTFTGLPYLPTPIEAFRAFLLSFVERDLWGHTIIDHCIASLERVGLGFAIAFVTAVPLGLIMGWFRSVRVAAYPIVEVLRYIPPIAWIPFSILLFRVTLFSSAFIVWIGAFFPILLNTIASTRNIGRAQLEVAVLMGAGRKDLMFKIVVPAALPGIITGVRVGLGVGWMCVIAAEFVGVPEGLGLGYYVWTMAAIGRYAEMVAGMLMIGIIGLLMNYAILFVERRILRWREEVAGY